MSQLEKNRDKYVEMLNIQIEQIMSSNQIITLKDQINSMTKEIDNYENLLKNFIESFNPNKINEYNEYVQKCNELENLIKVEENTSIITSFLKNYDNKIKSNIFKKILKIEVLHKAIDKFESEILTYREKLDTLNNQINDYNYKIKDKNEEIDKLSETKNELLRQIDELKGGLKLKSIMTEIDDYNTKIKEYNNEIKQLQNE